MNYRIMQLALNFDSSFSGNFGDHYMLYGKKKKKRENKLLCDVAKDTKLLYNSKRRLH